MLYKGMFSRIDSFFLEGFRVFNQWGGGGLDYRFLPPQESGRLR